MATMILAKILGIYICVVAVALLLNPGRFREIYGKFFRDDIQLLLGGIIALLFGAIIVSFHNVWVMAWPVLLTVLGWWGIIKGAALIACPKMFLQAFEPMTRGSDTFFRGIGVIWGLVGFFLLYQGWFA